MIETGALQALPPGWRYAPLDSLVPPERGISYGVVQPGRPTPDGVPIVRVNNVRDGRLLLDDVLQIERAIEATHARTRLRGGELLVTLVGSVGEVAVAPDELAGWNTARAVGVVPVQPEPGAGWVSYWFRSAAASRLVKSRLNTTVQATLNLRDLAAMPVPIPPPPERLRIAQVLGSLDDKIELNRELNATLQATARAIFRSWFADLSPVRARAEGRPTGLAPDLEGLFPSTFSVGAEGVPEGWSERPLSSIGRFLNGLALQKYPADGPDFLPVIKIAELRAGAWNDGDRANLAVPTDYVLNDGDLLFSWSGSLLHRVWCGGRGALNQHLFKVTSDTAPVWFLHEAIELHMPSFRETAAHKATTMGHIQRRHLDEALVVIPDAKLLKAADAVIGPMFERKLLNLKQNRTLAALRDLILPKLMSGELRVREAERAIEAVV